MSINVDLDRLKSFVAVGEELHFTRAAQNRLHVSQPWLSRSVKSLEQKLGVQLFDRHSRHVELTPPGRRLLYGARKILHDFDRTVSAVVRDRKGNGHLTVGYSPYVDLRFMIERRSCSICVRNRVFMLSLVNCTFSSPTAPAGSRKIRAIAAPTPVFDRAPSSRMQ